jgi:hypothetical protein
MFYDYSGCVGRISMNTSAGVPQVEVDVLLLGAARLRADAEHPVAQPHDQRLKLVLIEPIELSLHLIESRSALISKQAFVK